MEANCWLVFSFFPEFFPGLSFLILSPILYLHYKGHHTSLYIIFILFAKLFGFLFLSFGVSPNLSIKYKSDRHILDSFFQVICKDIKSSDLKLSPITWHLIRRELSYGELYRFLLQALLPSQQFSQAIDDHSV